MKNNFLSDASPRREFLGSLATGAAALGMAALAFPLPAKSAPPAAAGSADDPDAWFGQLKGKHRMVFDVTEPHGVFPFAWPAIFQMTNGVQSGPGAEKSVVVVLRHAGIGYAFEDRIWEKYHLGEVFGAKDPLTVKPEDPHSGTPATRNPFYKAKPFDIPGVGPVDLGIDHLQQTGIIFCMCNVAFTVNSFAVAQKMGVGVEELRKDWMSGLLPGIQVVPSGVWALGRAQEHGCAYCIS